MAGEYWLDDAAWLSISAHLPTNQPGAHRQDDRRIISGIVHVLRAGCRWQDCPARYGPSTTVYNRFHRWSQRGIWQRIFAALAATAPVDVMMIDSSAVKAHRSAGGGKGGPRSKRSAAPTAGGRPRSMPS